MRWMVLLLACLATAACTDGGTTATRMVYEDSGRLCLCAGDVDACGGVQRFEPDRPVRISFELTNICLSSSCSRDRLASCTVTSDGTALRVTTLASFTEHTGGPCTADCGLLSATCETEPLASGVYTLGYGDNATTFTVPSEAYSYCVSN